MYLFGLSGLIIGFTIGLSIIKIKNQKSYQKKILQDNILEKKINKVNEQQKELENYFNQNIHLLNIINNNYKELHQKMIKNSTISYINKDIHNTEKQPFQEHNAKNYKHLTHLESKNNNQPLIKEPRDYPESNNNYSK